MNRIRLSQLDNFMVQRAPTAQLTVLRVVTTAKPEGEWVADLGIPNTCRALIGRGESPARAIAALNAVITSMVEAERARRLAQLVRSDA